MRSHKKILLLVGFVIALAMVVAVWAGEPYKWPKDGEANGWGYFVDLYTEGGEHLGIVPMAWNPVTERWENLEGGEDPAFIQRNPDGSWVIVAKPYGEPPGFSQNPKLALHPDIDGDLADGKGPNFRLRLNAQALPGGASLRIFIVDSDGEGGPPDMCPVEGNRRDLFGTAETPIIYGPNEPIRGEWPVTIGPDGDMQHCDWIVFEIDDPAGGEPGDDGGVEKPPEGDDDTADDDTYDDDTGDDDTGDDDTGDDDTADDDTADDDTADDDTADDDTADDDTADDDTADDDTADDDDDDDDDFFQFVEDNCPLLNEIVAVSASEDFIELYNPTDVWIGLGNIFISNSDLYYGVVKQDNSVDTKSGAGGYFNARFPPDGHGINPLGFVTLSLSGSTNFQAKYGFPPDYELYEDDKASDAIPDLLEAFTGSINQQGDLSQDGPAVALYYWDDNNDLVCDCDIAGWGDMSGFIDKTGVSIDGIDADAALSDYEDDTVVADQDLIKNAANASDQSFNRCDEDEGDEERGDDYNGCNFDGTTHDETSEDLSNTWMENDPTPGLVNDCETTDDDTVDDDVDDDTVDDDTVDDDADDDADDDTAPTGDDDDDDDDGCCGCSGC